MGKMDDDCLWGYHPVREALRAKRRTVHTLHMVLEKIRPREEQLMRIARQFGVGVKGTSPQQLNTMVGHRRHQGICAQVSPYPLCSLDAILERARECGQAPFILALDQVVDPQNFGAIVRTAHCAGVHGIIIPKNNAAPPSAAVSKASAGALEHMYVACVTNMADALKRMKQRGIWLAGADQNGPETVFKSDLAGALAIVIGGEEKGIRPLVKKQCDFLVSVPQAGAIGSLNASAATAVVVYEAFRQRQR
jgi:23S rRNA (guanosine2251-2'-O)-methyltransferase